MPDPIPMCFRGGEAAEEAEAPPATTTTSVYETHLGLVALTWSRNVLGFGLRVDFRILPEKGARYFDDEEEVLRFHVRPWLLWKRRGSKRFELKDQPRHRHVRFTWDLTRARFSTGGGPEPAAGFFVSMDIGGEMVLVAGDLREEAYKKTKAQRPSNPFFSKYPVLISRREHVVLGESTAARTYNTTAIYNGKERVISIDLGGSAGAKEKERGDSGMVISVDGKMVLQIRRLKWKFRGSEKVEVDGGDRIQVSWDLHNWLFRRQEPPSQGAAPTAETAAVFVFRFERDAAAERRKWEEEEEKEEKEGCFGKKGGGVCRRMVGGYFGKNNGKNWSESSSGGGERRRKTRLMKTSSSSSMSSISSTASSSSVMEWASAEEVEMQKGEGFSLLVYAWKR